MSAGAPLKKNIKLPLEILQQLGALTAAGEVIKDALKELNKNLKDREKVVKEAGGDPEGDAGIRELQRRKNLLEQQQEENKRRQADRDKSVSDDIRGIKEQIAELPVIGKALAGILSGGSGSSLSHAAASAGSQASRAVTAAQNAVLGAAQSGAVSVSTATTAASALKAVGGVITGVNEGLAVFNLLADVGKNTQKKFMEWDQSVMDTNRTSTQIATQVLNFVNTGGASGDTFSGSFTEKATQQVEMRRKAAEAVFLRNVDYTDRLKYWALGIKAPGQAAAGEAAANEEMAYQTTARRMGSVWAAGTTLGALRGAPDFEARYQAKLVEKYGRGPGQTLLMNLHNLDKMDANAAQDEAALEVVNAMRQERVGRADLQKSLLDQAGGAKGGPEYRMQNFAAQKSRNVWMDARVARDYLADQQWNKF